MNFFLKLVGLPRKGSGSFGIDTKTIPKKFGAPSMSRTGDIPDDTVSSKFDTVSSKSEIFGAK